MINTVLRLSETEVVPIVIRPAPNDPCEWEPVNIDGVVTWYWLEANGYRLAGTIRDTAEQKRNRLAKRLTTGV